MKAVDWLVKQLSTNPRVRVMSRCPILPVATWAILLDNIREATPLKGKQEATVRGRSRCRASGLKLRSWAGKQQQVLGIVCGGPWQERMSWQSLSWAGSLWFGISWAQLCSSRWGWLEASRLVASWIRGGQESSWEVATWRGNSLVVSSQVLDGTVLESPDACYRKLLDDD